MSHREYVFVYGTLRSGASNAHRMQGAAWIGSACSMGRLYQVDWYPAFIPSSAGYRVKGDLWEVDPGKLRELDEFEGLPSGETKGEEYRRCHVAIEEFQHGESWEVSGSGEVPETAWAWVWVKSVDDLTEISSGDWLDVERPRQTSWFTSFGCLGLLAIPLGLPTLLGVIENVWPWLGDLKPAWVRVVALAASGVIGTLAGVFAIRRRELGLFLQVLGIAAGILFMLAATLLLLAGRFAFA